MVELFLSSELSRFFGNGDSAWKIQTISGTQSAELRIVLKRTRGRGTSPKPDDSHWADTTMKHSLTSMRHQTPNLEIWWYGIPPVGKKYQPGDEIEFVLEECAPGKSGRAKIKLTGRILERITKAKTDAKGYVHTKVLRRKGENDFHLYFGDRNDPESPLDVVLDR